MVTSASFLPPELRDLSLPVSISSLGDAQLLDVGTSWVLVDVTEGPVLDAWIVSGAEPRGDYWIRPRSTSAHHPGGVQGLIHVVNRLLGPGGCPWDQEQTHESLKKYLLEEAYELMDAIDAEDLSLMKEELGDVLLQPVMHAQMQSRDGSWDIEAVAQATADKLVHRHPHVFGDLSVADADEVLRNWDQLKKAEKGSESVLDGVASAAPALLRAHKISVRAARAGFEWENIEQVYAKLAEEVQELREASPETQASEIGDLLFTVVNLARWMKVDPEEALRQMVARFIGRFQHMESHSDKPLKELSPAEWRGLWNSAKSES